MGWTHSDQPPIRTRASIEFWIVGRLRVLSALCCIIGLYEKQAFTLYKELEYELSFLSPE